MSILVVDDDPKIRRLMRVELRASDFQVTEAANGEEALDHVAQEEPTLGPPGSDASRYRRHGSASRLRETSSVPVIIISAKHQDMDRIKGLQLGADDYITKPFNTEEVIERVRAGPSRARASNRWTELSGWMDQCYRFRPPPGNGRR